MVHAYHVIFGAYGFWLPNDPRGSWSDFVGSWELFRFGPSTKTGTRRSVASKPHDRDLRKKAKEALQRPAVQFTGLQAREIAKGFGQSIERGGVTVWACAILPEHVHMVFGRHSCKAEIIVNLLKGKATTALRAAGQHPFEGLKKDDNRVPTCWAAKCWKVFLNTDEEIVRAIAYVENNPVREGKPRQRWSFVQAFSPA